jgi:hypothetical protein
MRRPALALLALGLLLAPAAHAHDEDPIEAALQKPHATGLLVMGVVPESQAAIAGIHEGDVLVSYDGRPSTSLPALTAAKETAADKESIACVVHTAGGEERTVTLTPGPLGLQLVPVTKDLPPASLPLDSGDRFTLSQAAERDEWFVLSIDGKKAGLEHITTRVEGELLHFTHEVAFDGGEQWGLHHGIVRAVMRCGTLAEPVSLSYENGLNGWISRSRVERNASGRAVWHAVGGMPGEEPQVTENPLRGDQSSVPSYAVAQLVRLLPQEKDTVFRFRPVADWDGKPGLSAAIVLVGEETVTIGETEHTTFKYEQRQLGGNILGTYWFDARRTMIQASYGGPVATISTKEKAMEGLNETLKLRTAD